MPEPTLPVLSRRGFLLASAAIGLAPVGAQAARPMPRPADLPPTDGVGHAVFETGVFDTGVFSEDVFADEGSD